MTLGPTTMGVQPYTEHTPPVCGEQGWLPCANLVTDVEETGVGAWCIAWSGQMKDHEAWSWPYISIALKTWAWEWVFGSIDKRN